MLLKSILLFTGRQSICTPKTAVFIKICCRLAPIDGYWADISYLSMYVNRVDHWSHLLMLLSLSYCPDTYMTHHIMLAWTCLHRWGTWPHGWDMQIHCNQVYYDTQWKHETLQLHLYYLHWALEVSLFFTSLLFHYFLLHYFFTTLLSHYGKLNWTNFILSSQKANRTE